LSDSKWLNAKETTIKYPEASIYEIFLNVTERDLDKVIIEQGKESYTPRQLIEYSNKLADYFLSENIQPQDTISVLLPNTIWFVVSVFAALYSLKILFLFFYLIQFGLLYQFLLLFKLELR
jgi:acyl-CoA synthetase (AMP-forming)/AMP-acid ligase II